MLDKYIYQKFTHFFFDLIKEYYQYQLTDHDTEHFQNIKVLSVKTMSNVL